MTLSASRAEAPQGSGVTSQIVPLMSAGTEQPRENEADTA
jgi:hypothetical protein